MTEMDAVEAAARRAVDDGEVPGVVFVQFDDQRILYEGSFGRRSTDAADAMTSDTIFWFASMTKAIVSAAAMQLVEQGRFGLDDPVASFLPALAAPQVLEGFTIDGTPRLRPATKPITARHLLTHTAGFSYDTWHADMLRFMQDSHFESLLNARKQDLLLPLVADPGERWVYGINIDWIGQLIEAVTGQSLRSYLLESLLGPLGMADTDFVLTPLRRQRLARVHQRQPDGSLLPIEHEVSQTPEFYMGGGGLYGSALDYATFLQMLLNQGRSQDGVSVLRPETVASMGMNHIGGLRAGTLQSLVPELSTNIDFFPGMSTKWGLSFLINSEASATGRSAGSLSWAGLANTYFWADPAKKIGGVMMTHLFPFGDPPILRLYDLFERAAYGCLALSSREPDISPSIGTA